MELIVEGEIECGKVHTDFLRVKQVLYNLVHNAIKFTDQGRVSVSINRAAKGNLMMKVSDTGVGMDDATQERIFNRFIIADASRSRRHGGAGLGLAISRRLVDKLGGGISVSSIVGQGTTFSVEIPMQDCMCAVWKVSNTLNNIPDCSGMQILLAEDSDTNAYIARHFIEKCGARVFHVKNGKHAVEAASNVSFDLVLMDVSMPEMDGLQATRIIKQASKIEDVPIVALSAHVAANDLASCYEAGMCEFLSKPIDKAALYGVLARFSKPRTG